MLRNSKRLFTNSISPHCLADVDFTICAYHVLLFKSSMLIGVDS